MKRILFAVSGLLLAPLAFSAAPAHAATAARNYDCTKPGNANKAACKNAAVAAKPAVAPKARTYDCSKPGIANKAVCKSAAAPKPTVTKAPTTTVTKTTRNYDCTKAGNANKAVCKGTATTTTTVSRPAPSAPAARPAPAARAPASGQNTNPGGPNGATAKCRDGSYSHSAHRSGTCARHGGVAQWY